MHTYTLFLHTEGEDVPSFRVIERRSDDEARRAAAAELSFSRAASRAEVVCGDRFAGVVDLSRKSLSSDADMSGSA